MSRILVLDDDKRFAESLASLLEGLGYELLLAKNVDEARTQCAEQSPDFALVDLVLPGPEPDALVVELKDRNAEMPVVLMSGFFQQGKEVERMQRLCGTDLFLAKPFDFDRLVALLRTQLGDPSALGDGSQEPELDEAGRLEQTSLATVLMRASASGEAQIVDSHNQRGRQRYFVRDGRLHFWQSDQPGLNLPGLLGLSAGEAALAIATARHAHVPLLDALVKQGLCDRKQAILAWRMGALSLLQSGLLSPGTAHVRTVDGWFDILPDLELELPKLLLHGIGKAHPKRVQHYLAPRASGLLLPGPNFSSLEREHERVFGSTVRNQVSNSGTLSGEIMGRLWSDPRKRDRVYSELYALIVTGQVVVLQAAEDAGAQQPNEGFGVIQTSVEHHHDSLEGLDDEVVRIREDIRRLYDEQDGRDHYAALGVAIGATPDDITEAFRERFSTYHTDRFRGMELGSDLELLQRVLARWGEARDLLSNAEARKEYDLGLEREQAGASADVDALLAADGLVRKAEKAIETGHYKQAHQLMEQVLELRPDAEQYQFLSAFCAGMQGSEDAAATYERLKTLSEAATVPGSERMLGQMALRSGDQQQALRHLKSAVSARRDDFVAQRELRRLEA